MIPASVVPDDKQIIGPPDGWAFKLNVDPSRDWSGSTFTVDTPTEGLSIALDQSHKADDVPYVVLSLTSEQLLALGAPTFFRWNLAEDVVLARTFATQVVRLVAR